jgi:hypothetical protein
MFEDLIFESLTKRFESLYLIFANSMKFLSNPYQQFQNSQFLDGMENAFWVSVVGVHGGLGPARARALLNWYKMVFILVSLIRP